MSDLDFSAKEPSLGYIFQINYSLLLLMQSDLPDSFVQIECLDDIDLTYRNEKNLFQAKYHKKNTTNLTDRSKDFWRTIRIWSTYILEDKIDISLTNFILLTTSNVSEKSIISDIKEQKDIDEVILLLNKISIEKNQDNQKGYDKYQELNCKQKKELISNIKIADNSHNFDGIETEIKKLLRYSTTPDKITSLYERLTGWWLKQCVLNLLDEKENIKNSEIQEKIWFLNDSLKSDNLPIDYDMHIKIEDEKLCESEKLNYIKQLSLISMNKKYKKIAMSDYIRAYSQRSKWIREKLLNPQDEINYERKIKEYWERVFLLLEDDSENKTEPEKADLGKNFYLDYFYKNPPTINIKARCTDTFVVLGSYHILADNIKIGWHVDFKEKISEGQNARELE